MMPQIPDEQTIDAGWFNQCFHAAGIDAEVRDFTAQRVGTGQIGKCIRYTFDYATCLLYTSPSPRDS